MKKAVNHPNDLDLSVIIITLNEADNLERCLVSLPEGCELIVVDSGSTDATIEIAERFGAKIYTRQFDHFSHQKNFALAQASRAWVFSIDADEQCSPGLCQMLQDCGRWKTSDHQAFRVERRLVFMQKLMRWGKTRDAPIRLFPRQMGRFVGDIHEHLELDSCALQRLAGGYLLHHSYRDLCDYFQRFNRYTSAIADNKVRSGKPISLLSHCMRPWLEFLARYVFRLGFLDGYPGYCYALVSSLYSFVKYAKAFEYHRLQGGNR